MDNRDHAHVGGRQEAVIPEGQSRATSDYDQAVIVYKTRREHLKALSNGIFPKSKENPLLKDYAKRHLALKAGSRRPSTVERDERSLRIVLAYGSDDLRLHDITTTWLYDFTAWLGNQPGRKGRKLQPQTRLHVLHALSSLLKRARSEGIVEYNAVHELSDKPSTADREEAPYLEMAEAADLLEAALQMDAKPAARAIRYTHPLFATYLYTGTRKTEGFGLTVGDVDFDLEVVHVRPNKWRNLKKARHKRTVRLWPDLMRILSEYREKSGRTSGLLFPAPSHGGLLTKVQGSLDHAVELAGIKGKRVTLHTLRHTYTAARLQTTDGGLPVSPYTVMRELGHSDLKLIERCYGHLLSVRDRSAHVAYRKTRVVKFPAERAAS